MKSAGRQNGSDPGWLEFLDHTADAGIRVTAPDLATLFARAAWGMFSLITDPEQVTVIIHCGSRGFGYQVCEEIPEAYKDVANVVDACALAGIPNKVAQLRPLGCIKG